MILNADDKTAWVLLSGQGYGLLDVVTEVQQVNGLATGHAAEFDFVSHFSVAPETRTQSP